MATFPENAKGWIDLVKQAAIVLVVGYVVLQPATLGSWIRGTGLAKGSIFGIGWETKLDNTDEALQKANKDKADLEERLKKSDANAETLKSTIALLQRSSALPPLIAERAATAVSSAEKVLEQNRSVISAVQENLKQAQQVIAANSPLIQANATSPWLLLTGSDRKESEARDEYSKAKRAGFDKVKIYLNRGVYRTAVLYPDRQSAAQALPDAQAKLRPDAYIVSFEKWCANPQPKDNDLVECAGGDS